jgi:plasmid maintenance system killer protein
LNVYISDKKLEKLYTSGFSKKLKLPELVIEKFFSTIQKIESAINIYDFWNDKGLNFEKLVGYENNYSMRLSGKYRLEMKVNWLDSNKTIGDFVLIKISKHYGN